MNQQHVKIPTLLALVLVASLSIGGFFAYDRVSSFLSTATNSPDIPPENVSVFNITDSSFVVYWTTQEPVAATVRYGENSAQTAYDIRDTDQIPKQYTIHYIPVSSLSPEQIVPVEIAIGDSRYQIDNVTTAPRLDTVPQSLPLYGTVQTTENTPSTGALIQARIDSSTIWTTFISGTTDWILPTAPIRTMDGTAYYCTTTSCDEDVAVTIMIQAEEGTTTYDTTIANARPIAQTLVIGGMPLDPIREVSEEPEQEPEESKQVVQGAQATPTPAPSVGGTSTTISILNPKEDAQLRFTKPLFRGEGVPGKAVSITLDGALQQRATATVQESGMWLWTPPVSLDPGPYTLTISTTDTRERSTVLSRTFSIAKSGEQVLSSSTPSATISPGAETPTPTIPIIIEQPTPTPIIPTATPTPDLPVTANFAPSVILIAAGFLLVILSFALL